jgi:BACON domain-containing protein/all-beta uncharacterized protein
VTSSSLYSNGVDLEHCVIDETRYTNADAAAQSTGRSILNSRDAVVLIPRHPLPIGNQYSVQIVSGGTPYEWKFSISGTQNLPATPPTCTYMLSANSATAKTIGGSSNLTVTTNLASCAWTAASNTPFLALTSGTAVTGSGTVSYSVSANPGVSFRAGTLTIAGQTFTITQSGSGPAMSLDKPTLNYSGVTTGSGFSSQTLNQAVRLSQTGTGTVTWSALPSVSWLTVSPTSGTGAATLNVSVAHNPTLPGAGTIVGSVALSFGGAGSPSGPITVNLSILPAGTTAAPVGAFDTPADGSTGVTGSIPVTGWAMDDVQVSRVRILRDPVTSETPGVLVFLGDAVQVDGARPDVQALFPNSPRNTRAGWGYLLLTNFLPGLGNGTFKLYAIADDADGHSTTLGTKTITCTNSSATAPFGAIDTPVQGGTVSGTVTNFGWVLSNGPARSDPPSGGTVRVVIDGALAPGVPSGWTSRSDLTGLFPAATYPGIVNALGVAAFDSTTLTNGVHTISWLVTDNLGSASGIGSRYFTVSSGSLYLDPSQPGVTASGGSQAVAGPAFLALPRAAALRLDTVTSLAGEIAAAPADVRTINGRRGYDLNAALRGYSYHDGVVTIQSEELDRIELCLSETAGHRYTGYLRVGGVLAPLPIGSSLNAATGAFTWQPGVAFVGKYDLVFVRWSGGRAVARQDVRIVLNPKGSNRVGPQVVIDTPRQQQDVAQPFVLAGWAADLDSTVDVGVDTVHVWAYPLDAGRGGDPVFVGVAEYGGTRPDVAAIYGARFDHTGYGLRLDGLAPGTYVVAVFAYSTVKNGFIPAKTVRVTVR